MILDLLLGASALAALAGVLKRNLTAGALLVSFVVSEAMCKLGVEFNAVLWAGIDLMVIAFIGRPGMSRVDWVIIGLFFCPIWPLYVLQPDWWAQAVIVTIAVQMFLTFPAEWVRWFWRRSQWINRGWNPFDKFDLRGMAGATA